MPKSLIGKEYGKLKPIEYLGNKKYLCECKCGNKVEIFSSNLHGDMCCDDCKTGFRVDMTGEQHGYLKVKSYNKNTGKWICECKCGKKIEVKSSNLKSGNTSSCGKCKYIESANKDVIAGTRISQINSVISKNNTSGIKGVSYNSRKQKWTATIRFQGKNYWLGYHDDAESAKEARIEAEENLHGEFLKWYRNEYKIKLEKEKKWENG